MEIQALCKFFQLSEDYQQHFMLCVRFWFTFIKEIMLFSTHVIKYLCLRSSQRRMLKCKKVSRQIIFKTTIKMREQRQHSLIMTPNNQKHLEYLSLMVTLKSKYNNLCFKEPTVSARLCWNNLNTTQNQRTKLLINYTKT